jgi:hypothetical protein
MVNIEGIFLHTMTGIGKREPFKNIPEHSVHNEDHFQKKLFYDNLTC